MLFAAIVGLATVLLVAVACSSTTEVSSAQPMVDAGPADDTPDPASDAASQGRNFGEKCGPTATCAEGLLCETFESDTGFCSRTCAGLGDCEVGEVCTGLRCHPGCKGGTRCPSGFYCYDSSVCLPDCRKWPDLCSSGLVCKLDYDQYACVEAPPPPPPPPPPPGQCKPATTTASSGVTGSKQVGSLSMSDKVKLCDWAAGRYGGYGCEHKCDGGVNTKFSADASSCSAKIKPGCTATVAQVEECYVLDSEDPCAFAILSSPKCAPLRASSCQ